MEILIKLQVNAQNGTFTVLESNLVTFSVVKSIQKSYLS